MYLGLEYYTDSGTVVWFFSPGASSGVQVLPVPAHSARHPDLRNPLRPLCPRWVHPNPSGQVPRSAVAGAPERRANVPKPRRGSSVRQEVLDSCPRENANGRAKWQLLRLPRHAAERRELPNRSASVNIPGRGQTMVAAGRLVPGGNALSTRSWGHRLSKREPGSVRICRPPAESVRGCRHGHEDRAGGFLLAGAAARPVAGNTHKDGPGRPGPYCPRTANSCMSCSSRRYGHRRADEGGPGSGSQGTAVGGVSFSPAIESVDGGLIVTVAHDITDRPARIVAATRDGRIVTPSQSQCDSAGKARQTTASFKGVALAQVAEFRFQVRPWTWSNSQECHAPPESQDGGHSGRAFG